MTETRIVPPGMTVEEHWQYDLASYPGISKRTFAQNRLFGAVSHELLSWILAQSELHGAAVETGFWCQVPVFPDLRACVHIDVTVEPTAGCTFDIEARGLLGSVMSRWDDEPPTTKKELRAALKRVTDERDRDARLAAALHAALEEARAEIEQLKAPAPPARPPLAGDNLTPRHTDALPLSPSGYGALRQARAELRADRDEIAALCAHRDSLEAELRKSLASECEKHAERDRARASAIEWAATPIHRLLAAYNVRTQDTVNPQPGHLRHLVIREGERGWWWIDWARWTDSFGWTTARQSAGTLDAACTAAAELIEDA